MKKITFIMSGIGALLGVLILSATSILVQLMPVLGRIAYQWAAAGSYSSDDFTVSFTFPNILAIILIIICSVCMVLTYKSERN